MKNCVIISGGRLEDGFAFEFIQKEQPQLLIAADKGLSFCHNKGIVPTQIVGDFDTLGDTLLPEYEALGVPVRRFNPVKDATDTEIALRLALKLGAEKITILGASQGNRIDHLFGNVQTMVIAAEAGADCRMLDSHNRMRILTEGIRISKEEQYGKYISLVPLTSDVYGVTLTGFKYPLMCHHFSVYESGSLGISNELTEAEGRIEFTKGMLLLLECRD